MFEILKSDDGKLTLDGAEVNYRLDALSEGMYTLWIDNVPYTISHRMLETEDYKREIRVNGLRMELTIEDERDVLLRKFDSSKATKLQSAVIKAPMPGKIARILVAEGELIEEGQGVVILEAMKMENELKSPAAGIVKRIHAEANKAVEKNTVLIEID